MKEISLAVDGSTYAGTVAVISGNELVAERSLPDSGIPSRGQRGEHFMPMVVACMNDAGVSVKDVDRVICGGGPGSFTSLRIAASIAKGIAAGIGCPLFSVSSLILIPAASNLQAGIFVAALPAMRGDTYLLDVDVAVDGTVSTDGMVRLVPNSEAEGIAQSSGRVLIGPDFGDHLKPNARGAARVIGHVIAAGPCDLDSWEPAYGRLAEAQVKWEAQHGRPLAVDA